MGLENKQAVTITHIICSITNIVAGLHSPVTPMTSKCSSEEFIRVT
jgi:hypothetical protein